MEEAEPDGGQAVAGEQPEQQEKGYGTFASWEWELVWPFLGDRALSYLFAVRAKFGIPDEFEDNFGIVKLSRIKVSDFEFLMSPMNCILEFFLDSEFTDGVQNSLQGQEDTSFLPH